VRRLRGWDYYPLGDRCFQGPLRWAMKSPGWTPFLATQVPWLLPLRVTVEGVLRSSTYCQVLVDIADQEPRALLVAYLHPIGSAARTLRIQRLLWPDRPPKLPEIRDALWRCTAAAMSLKARYLEIEVTTPETVPCHPLSLNLLGVAHEPGAYELYGEAGMRPFASASYAVADAAELREVSRHPKAEPGRTAQQERLYDEACGAHAQRHWKGQASASSASASAQALGSAFPCLHPNRCLRLWQAGNRRYFTYCIPDLVQGPSPASRLERGGAARLLRLVPVEGDGATDEIQAVVAALAGELLRESPSITLLHAGPVPETDVALRTALADSGFRSAGGLQILRRETS
jgi:hypothetical protein